MRLSWKDWFREPLREIKPDDAKKIYDIGIRVVGFHSGDVEATDTDIDYVKNVFEDAGLLPGTYFAGKAAFHPDPAVCKDYKKHLAKALRIAGKLGCTTLRLSVGSMDASNVYKNHPENHTQKALDMLIESTREIVRTAEDAGCMLCPETNQWTIVNSIERMKE